MTVSSRPRIWIARQMIRVASWFLYSAVRLLHPYHPLRVHLEASDRRDLLIAACRQVELDSPTSGSPRRRRNLAPYRLMIATAPTLVAIGALAPGL